jgi:hypothetical protein
MALKPEIKKQWVEALRSGEYQQGKMQLHKGDLFCCLGVLCALAVRAGADVEVRKEYDDVFYDGDWSGLPKSVMDWSGMETANGFTKRHLLIEMNDTGSNFAEIADVIEREF